MLKVTLIVESDHHVGGENKMSKSLEAGNDNQRFYPSQVEGLGAELVAWASGGMTNLIGGSGNALSDGNGRIIVKQDEWRQYVNAFERLRSIKLNGPEVIVTREELARLKARDALLGAMEIAGVDNWEGMDNVERPEGA
jgi:hypothetical protein